MKNNVQRPIVETVGVPLDYRGEDAHKRFRLVELKIVQEHFRRIEDDIAVEDDDDGEVTDGQSASPRTRPGPTLPSCLGAERTRREFETSSDVGSSLSVFLRVRDLNPRRRLPPSVRKRPGWPPPC